MTVEGRDRGDENISGMVLFFNSRIEYWVSLRSSLSGLFVFVLKHWCMGVFWVCGVYVTSFICPFWSFSLDLGDVISRGNLFGWMLDGGWWMLGK